MFVSTQSSLAWEGSEWSRDETRGAFYCPMSPLASALPLGYSLPSSKSASPAAVAAGRLTTIPAPLWRLWSATPHPTPPNLSTSVQQLYRLPCHASPVSLPLSSIFGAFLTNSSCSRTIGCVVRNTNRLHAAPSLRQDRIVSLPPSSLSPSSIS